MKKIALFLVCLFTWCASGHAAGEMLRLRIDWLNARESGFEDCRPQDVVMREGSVTTFAWPESKDRGFFEIRPSWQGENVAVLVKRRVKPNQDTAETNMEGAAILYLGRPETIALGKVQLTVTITREP